MNRAIPFLNGMPLKITSTVPLSIFCIGPVYLENKAREVIYKGEHGLVWQKGIVTLREHFVKVNR